MREGEMKGLFIPEITAEMFRNGCLEGIEALMAEGEIYDIEYDPKHKPERKRGRWEHIYIKRRGYTRDDRTPRTRESAYCTACRAIVPELKKISRGDSKYRTICNVFNFCPNCGADMRGEEDETD